MGLSINGDMFASTFDYFLLISDWLRKILSCHMQINIALIRQLTFLSHLFGHGIQCVHAGHAVFDPGCTALYFFLFLRSLQQSFHMGLHLRCHSRVFASSRTGHLQIQEGQSTWRCLDNSTYWKVCGLHESYHGRLFKAMEFRRSECSERL